jgi:hypothetical protein
MARAALLPEVREMRMRHVGAAAPFVIAALLAACGNRPSPPVADKKDAAPADAEAAVEIAGRALGLPDLAAYGWRRRAGQPAFRNAR